MRVLIVEDDRWYAESLISSLQSAKDGKIEIGVAHDANEVMQEINMHIPDVIILDFYLGLQNALVVLNELQSYTDTRAIPIILLSSDGTRMSQKDYEQYGVKAIYDKMTVTPQEIYQCLKA